MTVLGGFDGQASASSPLPPASLPPAPSPAQPRGLISRVVRLHIPSNDRAETRGIRTSWEGEQAWFLRLWPWRCFWSQKQQKGL